MSNIYVSEPPTSGKVVLETTVGDIEIELWSKETPKTCRNFLQLCMEGYFDNTVFHRVVPGWIVQGGDPSGTGEGGESIYNVPFADEFHSRLRFSRRGLVGMANSGPNENRSQFFITLAPTPELQKKNTLFATVVGDSLFNALKLGECEVDKETERPIYPRKIINTRVLDNPFADIITRTDSVGSVGAIVPKARKKQIKAVKDKRLLSFADDEDGSDLVATTGNPTMKSSHDLLASDLALGDTDGSLTNAQNASISGWIELPDDKELMEQVYVKLEMVGFRVGRRLAERFAPLNRRLTDTLDVVKFVCKDVWVMLFNRQIDNLKTNHRGIYVLQDNKFKWFLRMSGNSGGAAAARRAQPYIWLPCGIIRGVLDSFGVSTVVIAETLGLPQCTFQIKVVSGD
ncbi:Peptidyl-prolyl isomerase cwc27 [Coemansia sp. RSA 2559]|nr:Peptidyl-prolyl isomerase cwc27 [Coemansia sp. RSA 2559]